MSLMKSLKTYPAKIPGVSRGDDSPLIREALARYEGLRPLYGAFCQLVRQILVERIRERAIKIHSIEARAKSVESFEKKAARLRDSKPSARPLGNLLPGIADLAGVRVITFFPRTISEIDEIVHERLLVLEKDNKSETLNAAGQFGYQSVHYLVALPPKETEQPDRKRFRGLVAEIQVRTILQHAWAEIEHDIQYKSVRSMPPSVRRRLAALAGLLEIADREFQTLHDEDDRLRRAVRDVGVRDALILS